MNINSSSYFSVSASTNKGMSGMVSGMDTESLVKQMLSGTQKKIDAQESLKQQSVWKQEIYRDVIKSINEVNSKYFDTSYGSSLSTNLASSDFFNSMMSSVKSGNALKVNSTGSSALTADMRIAVTQLASNASLKSSKPMSPGQNVLGNNVTDEMLAKTLEKSVSLSVGGVDLSVNLNNVNTDDGMVEAFNKTFKDAGITNVSAKMHEGRLRLISEDPSTQISLSTGSSSRGLEMTGFSDAKSSELTDINGVPTGNMLQGKSAKSNTGISFQVTLDGVQKNININTAAGSDGKITVESVQAELQKQLNRAFGDYIKTDIVTTSEGKKFNLSLNTPGEVGHEFAVTGADAKLLGIAPGSSSHMNGLTKLGTLGVSGEKFSFSINNRSFTFSATDSVSTLINAVNNSDAGVKLTYSTLSDTFNMEATSSGEKFGINISQTEGDILSVMFGSDKIAAGSKASSSELTTGSIKGTQGGLEASYSTAGGSLKMNVNGTNYTFNLPQREDKESYTKDEVESEFNSWLSNTFKSTGPDDAKVPNISFNNGTLSIADGFVVKFAATTVDTENADSVDKARQKDFALAFGFNTKATSNVATAETALSDIYQLKGLDVKDSNGNVATKLGDVASVNGYDIGFSAGRLEIKGGSDIDLSSQDELAKLFKTTNVKLSDGSVAQDVVTSGKNAKVLVNGVEISRSSNSFTIDDVAISLTNLSEKKFDSTGAHIGYDETVIGTVRDVDKLVDGIKSFVKDYNEMIDKVNGYYYQDPSFRKYDPLTSEQKKEMDDAEIERWEKKSKEGLVRNDDTIGSFLSSMRSVIYQPPAGSKIALYSIGIETTNAADKGKIKLDESALRSALNTDPDAVRNLFSGEGENVSTMFKSAMDSAAKMSAATPGSLVQLAGADGWTTNEKTNTMYDRIKSIENRIHDLKVKYERERQRYWNQFNSMESILSGYSSQSSFIAQQFGQG